MSQPLDSREVFQLPNVAAVPQFSPFRYPGGKSRWYPLVRAWVESHEPLRFIEPFAGAAHAGLAVALEDWGEAVEEVILIEKDENISTVWDVILNGDVEWLCDRIEGFEVERRNLKETIYSDTSSDKELAFKTILHNRLSRGGIIAPGSGILNRGEDDNGIDSRWYPNTLIDRIKKIKEKRGKINIVEGDAFEVWPKFLENDCDVHFIDPPYPESGKRLYRHSDVKPEKVFVESYNSNSSIMITYESTHKIKMLSKLFGMKYLNVNTSNAHNNKINEVVISNDLSFLSSVKVMNQ